MLVYEYMEGRDLHRQLHGTWCFWRDEHALKEMGDPQPNQFYKNRNLNRDHFAVKAL